MTKNIFFCINLIITRWSFVLVAIASIHLQSNLQLLKYIQIHEKLETVSWNLSSICQKFLLLKLGLVASYPSWICFLSVGTLGYYDQSHVCPSTMLASRPALQYFYYNLFFTEISLTCERVVECENALKFTLRDTPTNYLVRAVFE